MQTFLPYPDFVLSAQCLDRQRLGKQRVEALQILRTLRAMRTLTGQSAGWQNHPAVRMWAGHERSLADYGIAVCDEWIARGYKDNCRSRFRACRADRGDPPSWLGDERLHASHRSNLLRKAPEHYGVLGWKEGPELLYWWPTKSNEGG